MTIMREEPGTEGGGLTKEPLKDEPLLRTVYWPSQQLPPEEKE
jgi:hypothetical protein